MQKLYNFLNINFSEEMLSPSFGGKKWEGNSSFKRKFSILDKTNNLEHLSISDQKYLINFLGNILSKEFNLKKILLTLGSILLKLLFFLNVLRFLLFFT